MASVEFDEKELVHVSLGLAREILRYQEMGPAFAKTVAALVSAREKVVDTLNKEYPIG